MNQILNDKLNSASLAIDRFGSVDRLPVKHEKYMSSCLQLVHPPLLYLEDLVIHCEIFYQLV